MNDRRVAIESALGCPIATCVELDHGYDSSVWVVDGEWVFRFPRRPAVVRTLEREAALLPELARELPAAVPLFEHVRFEPVAFAGYRLVDGDPLPADASPDLARAIAEFLTCLHGFDTARAESLGVERPDWRLLYAEQCAEFERRVLPLLDRDERGAATTLLAECEQLGGHVDALVHNDLGPEHLLCLADRLTGVIDWGDVAIGDPAVDASWLLFGMPKPFADAFLEAYAGLVDERFRGRAHFYHRLAPWYEAHYGLFTNQPDHVAAGLDEVRRRLAPGRPGARRSASS